MVKVNVISGFLGAGKTTFLAKLLENGFKDEKIVLIENEFGEIGVDSYFLQESKIEISELNSGCICCSLVGDFTKNLQDVVAKYHPDRILIEPSGVGKLSDIIKAINETKQHVDLQLDSALTIVDAIKGKMYFKNFKEFFEDQIKYAGIIACSRTQMCKADALAETVKMLHTINPQAKIITTPWDEIDVEEIIALMNNQDIIFDLPQQEHHHHHHDHDEECDCDNHHHDHDEECGCGHHHDHDEECSCGHHHDHGEEGDHHHHHHHTDEIFNSWGTETIKHFTYEELEEMLKEVINGQYGEVLRAKGLVESTDGKWLYFDVIPDARTIEYKKASYTGRICIIGSHLKEDKLKELFKVD